MAGRTEFFSLAGRNSISVVIGFQYMLADLLTNSTYFSVNSFTTLITCIDHSSDIHHQLLCHTFLRREFVADLLDLIKILSLCAESFRLTCQCISQIIPETFCHNCHAPFLYAL